MSDDSKNARAGALGSIIAGLFGLGGVWVAPEMAQGIATLAIVVVGALPSWVKMIRGR